jgi:hypothetical protein
MQKPFVTTTPPYQPGFLTLSKHDVAGHFKSLIDDLMSPQLADVLSEKLNLDLTDKPRMITFRRISKKGDGRIHNDGKAKICTMLICLNDDWDNADGVAIRALNSDTDMDVNQRKLLQLLEIFLLSPDRMKVGTDTLPSQGNYMLFKQHS